jgi:hypothetical protein
MPGVYGHWYQIGQETLQKRSLELILRVWRIATMNRALKARKTYPIARWTSSRATMEGMEHVRHSA